MNSFGNIFKITLFGTSHGPAIGITIDGVPAGLQLSPDELEADLARRRSDGTVGCTPRREADIPEILSGLYNGHTDGTPITVVFRNGNTRGGDYTQFRRHPRPSHADLTAATKYNGFNNPEGGGMFSGRLTAPIVAAGVIAKKILSGITFTTRIVEIGGETDPIKFDTLLTELRKAGNSAGGIVEITAHGIAAGIGEPFFDSVESMASHLVFAIPGVKGIEFGAGFTAARRLGSDNNDCITDRKGTTATNNDGGIHGGITNGNDVVMRVAFKPTPSISTPQDTYDFSADSIAPLSITGRHDACIALRGAVVAETALAIALADLYIRNGCTKMQKCSNYE